MSAAEPIPQNSGARFAYILQFWVCALLALNGPAAYAVTGDILVLDYGTLWGVPWSIPLWFVDPQSLSPWADQALVLGCTLLNVVLLAALLRFAWVNSDRGAYTTARNGTWKVAVLAGGALLLVALGNLSAFYSGSLDLVPALFGHPFLFGCAAALMLPSAMYYLIPWRWVSHSLLTMGVCVAGLWGMIGLIVTSLQRAGFD